MGPDQDLDHLVATLSADPSTEPAASEIRVLQSIYGDEAVKLWRPPARPLSGRSDATIRYIVSINLPEPYLDIPLLILVSIPPTYPSSSPPQLQLLSKYIGPYGVSSSIFGAVLRTFISTNQGVEWTSDSVCVFDGLEHIKEQCGKWYAERLSEKVIGEIVREEGKDGIPKADPYTEAENLQQIPVPSARSPPPLAIAASLPNGIKIIEAEPITDRKSSFVGRACRITDPAQVPLVLSHLLSNRRIARAAHPVINAWRCQIGAVMHQDNEDDGETAAGGRLAHLLQILEVNNVLVVVTRYFGGTLLGADRFKHINQAARNALEIGGFLDSPTSDINSKRTRVQGKKSILAQNSNQTSEKKLSQPNPPNARFLNSFHESINVAPIFFDVGSFLETSFRLRSAHSLATKTKAMLELSLYWDADDDVEDIRRYTPGGFHPIRLGDVVSSQGMSSIAMSVSSPRHYRILHKLGRGAFATVWLAEVLHEPSQRYVALKICAADADPDHELNIFRRFSQHESKLPNVLQLRDNFSLQGPNGVHTVLVNDVLGSLLSVVRSISGHKRARTLCHQITCGLAALHSRGIVHGATNGNGYLDLHAGNVGITLPTLNEHPPREILDYFGRPECTIVLPTVQPALPQLPPYLVPPISVIDYLTNQDPSFIEGPLQAEIMDLGSAIIVNEQTRPACTPVAVCAPEIVFQRVVRSVDPPPTRASDVWSLACTIYELVFGARLFHFASPNDTLLGAMAALCGEVPQEWRSYWDSRERLRGTPVSHENADAEWQRRLKHWTEGPGGKRTEADVAEIFALLRSMLKMDPKRRATAEDVMKHLWFTRDHDGGTLR